MRFVNMTSREKYLLTCDEVFVLYLGNISKQVNAVYYRTVLKFVLLYRDCLNQLGWYKRRDHMIKCEQNQDEQDHLILKKIERMKNEDKNKEWNEKLYNMQNEEEDEKQNDEHYEPSQPRDGDVEEEEEENLNPDYGEEEEENLNPDYGDEGGEDEMFEEGECGGEYGGEDEMDEDQYSEEGEVKREYLDQQLVNQFISEKQEEEDHNTQAEGGSQEDEEAPAE